MFNFLRKTKVEENDLINQVVGGQSVLLKIFQEALKESPEKLKKLELTYFALSVFTYVFLRLSNLETNEKELVADKVALNVLEKSLPHSNQNISMREAQAEYQRRYQEYNVLINAIFDKEGKIDSHSNTTLAMHFYEMATGHSAEGKMIDISLTSPLIAQYVLDHIDFMKTKGLTN